MTLPGAGDAVAGIDLGATKALAVARRGDGREVERRWRTGRATGPDEVLGLVAEVLDWARGEGIEPQALGLGFPGVVDDDGVVRSSVMLDGWSGIDLATVVGEATGLPAAVDNDVNCAALAEARLRPGTLGMVMVAAGTGIGGAVVLGGQLWRGVGGLAGEIGHTSGARGAGACDCGGTDCLHLLAGGRAIAERRAGSGAPAPPPGDTDRWHLDAAEALGIAAADAVSVLAVPLVVVGGGLAELRGFVDAVSDAFHRHLMAELSAACSVEPARAGYRAGALGAVSLARGVLTRTAPRAAPSG